MLYGQVVSLGDGFDAAGHVFRPMPHLDAPLPMVGWARMGEVGQIP